MQQLLENLRRASEREPHAITPRDDDHYTVLGLVGKGTFGVVSKIRRKAAAGCVPALPDIGAARVVTVERLDTQELVWKELNYGLMNEREKQQVTYGTLGGLACRSLTTHAAQIVAEVNILRELRHPFIVRYYDRIIDKVRTATRAPRGRARSFFPTVAHHARSCAQATTKLYIVMENCSGETWPRSSNGTGNRSVREG